MNHILYITQGAIIAALYVVVCLVFAPISYGAAQLRIAEALTIMPLFTSAAIPGLTIGCMLANIIGGGAIPDIILGTLATLIGAIGTYYIRRISPLLGPIPPILANTLTIPWVLKYGYGIPMPIPLMMGAICIGEVASCGVLGLILYKALEKAHIQFGNRFKD